MRVCAWICAGMLLSSPIWASEEPIQEIDCRPSSAEAPGTPGKRVGSRANLLPDELALRFTIRSHGPDGPREEEVDLLPNVAVELRDGWLLGLDYGEWGGTLRFRSGQSETEILSENILDIFEMAFGYVVVTGLSHLGLNQGALYLVRRGEGGFTAEKLFQLPGEPNRALELASGLLLDADRSDTSYVLRDDGSFHEVSEPLGTYLLQNDGSLRRVRCKETREVDD